MNKTRLSVLCRVRDNLWDRLIDAKVNEESHEVIELIRLELNEVENDIHNMLYKEVRKERENDLWMEN